FNLGNTLMDMGERAAAKATYERVLVLQPGNADAIASLADIAEKEHRLDDAIRLADRALSIDANNVTGRLPRARVALRQKDYEAARGLLEKVQANERLSLINRAVAEGLIGQVQEKLGNYSRAFAAFKTANKALFELHAPMFANDRGPTSLEAVKR